MKKWMIISDCDITFDNPNESLGQALERLTEIAPSAFVQVWKYEGSGGGWPQCAIVCLEEDVDAVLEFIGFDEYDRIERRCELVDELV